MKRASLILALLLAAVSIAHSDGIFNPGGRGINAFEGPFNSGAAAPPIPSCSGTGLNFTVACNSQYIGII